MISPFSLIEFLDIVCEFLGNGVPIKNGEKKILQKDLKRIINNKLWLFVTHTFGFLLGLLVCDC